MAKTLGWVTQWFYWPGVKAQVYRYCESCQECQLHREHVPHGRELQRMPTVTVPFECVGIDIVGPLLLATS